jgi:flagellin-like hook-associated protein FlgL
MSSATYKGKDIFVDTAGSEYVSMGGRNAEMTFGIGKIDYTEVFGATRTIDDGLPNAGQLMNLTSMPSDAVVGPTFTDDDAITLTAGKIYEITTLPTDSEELVAYKAALLADGATTLQLDSEIVVGSTFEVTSADNIDLTKAVYTTLKQGEDYVVSDLNGLDGDILTASSDALDIAAASDVNADLVVGTEVINITGDIALDEGYEFQKTTTDAAFREIDASQITRNIEAVQKKINTARVQAGSQYAALESAVIFTTDLTAQYELGYNTVHDVNFSMETAHLAKNQILQQAATAMLAQANQGQQGLLQLIQG